MESYIKNFIKENGAISFSKFMELSMYHPEKGYYMTRNPIGKNGDYITAPEITSLFGKTMVLWLFEQWEKLGRPDKINIVEFGPGSGMMMLDIISAISRIGPFYDAVRVYMVEISPFLRKVQMETLHLHASKIIWCNSIEDVPEGKLLILANEFFDALPIDQFVFLDGRFFERKITEDLEIEECETQLTFKGEFRDGDIIEANFIGKQIATSMLDRIARCGGKGLIIDYGHSFSRRRNTLQAVKGHQFSHIFQDIGEADLTYEVDFSWLFPGYRVIPQRDFLYSYGIFELASRSTATDKTLLQQTLSRLVDPTKMGELFKCVII